MMLPDQSEAVTQCVEVRMVRPLFTVHVVGELGVVIEDKKVDSNCQRMDGFTPARGNLKIVLYLTV
jgi:hypothetical protein